MGEIMWAAAAKKTSTPGAHPRAPYCSKQQRTSSRIAASCRAAKLAIGGFQRAQLPDEAWPFLPANLRSITKGRPRGAVGKASASEARCTGFEPPWLVQWSRWESRPLSLVGNGAGPGAVTHPIDRKGTVFPRGTGRFLVKKVVHIASFRSLSEETLTFFL